MKAHVVAESLNTYLIAEFQGNNTISNSDLVVGSMLFFADLAARAAAHSPEHAKETFINQMVDSLKETFDVLYTGYSEKEQND